MIAEQDEEFVGNRYRDHSEETYSPFKVKDNSLLVLISPLDGAEQTVFPESLHPKVMYISHYPLLDGHPKGSKMYDSMIQKYYWSRMANGILQTTKDCRPYEEARGTRYMTQKLMKLFPATKPLEYIAVDLLRPFPPTENGSTNILVITDLFSKLDQVTPLSSTTAPAVANAFINNCVIPYGLPVSILSDNGPQFVAKFFEAVCLTLGLKQVTSTAYHPQTNGQTERYNHT